jgi:hypothetical protein
MSQWRGMAGRSLFDAISSVQTAAMENTKAGHELHRDCRGLDIMLSHLSGTDAERNDK